MTLMMMPTTDGEPGVDPVRRLTLGLRTLIVSGDHFRDAKARNLQLGPSDVIALGHLYNDGPLTPRELSRRMGMTSGTMTALLDRVAKAGYLTRNDNPEDRRSLLIMATPAGQHAMEWVYEQFDAVIRDALTDLPETAGQSLGATLELLGDALESQAREDASTATPPAAKKRQTGPRSI